MILNRTLVKRKPFGKAPRVEREGEVIHVNLVTPLNPTGYNESKGYMSIIDDKDDYSDQEEPSELQQLSEEIIPNLSKED